MESRVLITGASGFVGRAIVKELVAQDVAAILALDRLPFDFADHRVTFSQANLLNKDELTKDIGIFKPTSVIHLAAIASPVYGNVAELYDINVHGSENLLDVLRDTCSKGTRVILTSTAGVYGNSGKEFITEDTPYNPQNHYSFSKMVMEYMSKAYQDALDIKIVRPFNMIGAGQNETFLVPKLVQAFVTKQPTLAVGNMQTYRDFVDVDFAAKIFCRAALTDKMDGNYLNICAGKATSGQDIVSTLTELTGYTPEIQINPKFIRKNEIMRLVGDPTKCNRLCNNDFHTKTLRKILADMVSQYSHSRQ